MAMQPRSTTVSHGTDAITISGPRVNAVILGPNYFSESADGKQRILIHELLHAYTHWGDDEIFAAFKEYGLVRVNPGTDDISAWLQRDCKGLKATPTRR